MSYAKIFLHYVWATKDRKHLLMKPYRQKLFKHMRENAVVKGIHLDRINGYTNHVHCLVWLQPQQSYDKVAQLLKGESAYWFNNVSGCKQSKLQWQSEYFVVSVSPSMIEKVRTYVDNQEMRHRKISFEKEYEQLIEHFLLINELQNKPIGMR